MRVERGRHHPGRPLRSRSCARIEQTLVESADDLSHAVSAWAWQQTATSPAQKLVLVKLADSANDDGVCWPSLRTLERHLGMGKSSVDRHVKKLVEAGLMTVEQRNHTAGRRRSNLYRLGPPTLSHPGGTTSEGTLSQPERDNVVPPRAGHRTVSRTSKPANAGSRPRPVFDALIIACYGEGKTHRDLTRTAQGEVNAAARQIEALDATAEDVVQRATAYRKHDTLGGVMLTPSALVKHWPSLAPKTKTQRAICPDCGVGGGQHIADCPQAKGT